jgi:hypothetical protein
LTDAAEQEPRIVITYHARKRAEERFDLSIANNLEQLARASRRTDARKDGLQAYRHDRTGVVFLMVEKQGVTMGGLYELEAITVITTEMLGRMKT